MKKLILTIVLVTILAAPSFAAVKIRGTTSFSVMD